MTLYINDNPAHIGEVYITFRGEPVTLLHITPPHKPSSSGRVYVQYENGATGEYFPSVIGGVWR